ncbi:hypothetical protein [Enhygromyxa salina]|uniref:Tetracyclin repressor-like C-terminal domain-containing protein n=1 Tax=Enhygromyxa salina TaxID=215803 RepID=A0A2S9YN01_9BACT|nr:hypothetical protein [Enhygromyxa salina]PRQ06473.1 hypothetical protein ENSA7_37920 [Enhygromyxa salina]
MSSTSKRSSTTKKRSAATQTKAKAKTKAKTKAPSNGSDAQASQAASSNGTNGSTSSTSSNGSNGTNGSNGSRLHGQDGVDPIYVVVLELVHTYGPRVSLSAVANSANVPLTQLESRFSRSEDIVVSFICDVFDRAHCDVQQVDGIESFTVAEKIHALLEAILERLEPHRDLLPRVSLQIGASSLLRSANTKQLRQRYVAIVSEFFRHAIEANELPQIDLDGPIIGSFADHASTVVAFWLRDNSPNHQATTEYIDQSLSVVIPAAVSTARLAQLGTFFRRQLQGFVRSGPRDTGSGFRPLGFHPTAIRHRFSR